MDSRVLAVAALVALLAFAAPVSALAPDASLGPDEECGGRIAVGCWHYTAPGYCVLYMNGQCIIWQN
jgi:hypothetical protein